MPINREVFEHGYLVDSEDCNREDYSVTLRQIYNYNDILYEVYVVESLSGYDTDFLYDGDDEATPVVLTQTITHTYSPSPTVPAPLLSQEDVTSFNLISTTPVPLPPDSLDTHLNAVLEYLQKLYLLFTSSNNLTLLLTIQLLEDIKGIHNVNL